MKTDIDYRRGNAKLILTPETDEEKELIRDINENTEFKKVDVLYFTSDKETLQNHNVTELVITVPHKNQSDLID